MAEIFMVKYYSTSLSMNGTRRFRDLTVRTRDGKKDVVVTWSGLQKWRYINTISTIGSHYSHLA